MFWVTVVRPKSVIRARPVSSARIFGWTCVSTPTNKAQSITYSFEVAMNYVAGVKIVNAFSDIAYLGRE